MTIRKLTILAPGLAQSPDRNQILSPASVVLEQKDGRTTVAVGQEWQGTHHGGTLTGRVASITVYSNGSVHLLLGQPKWTCNQCGETMDRVQGCDCPKAT